MLYSAEIMSFTDFGVRDIALEEESEARLLAWQLTTKKLELMLLGNSFLKRGLINLYQICG
ncbi:Protein of unknown function DUF3468 [Penicillium canescens]|nr:Protein of unknown function DUF3468 [Penicillium canescens]